ncbi:UPF0764 protein C16orf89 homolog [Scylla paramamosain]|uniref:UPF0764 protein C16orf89 homolog n=1 Tax=Scylla paramamosain TaxID=85552 RepID=UPI0030839FE1
MAQFASIVLIPLVAAVWIFPPPAQVKKGVKAGGKSQETRISKHSLAKNPRQPHLDLNMLIARPDNSLDVQEQQFDIEGPLRSWVGKAFTDDFLQYDGVSLPLLLMVAVVGCTQLLNYYREHLELMNLDAVMGTRIAEGQFSLALVDVSAEEEDTTLRDPSSSAVAAALRRLQVGAALVSEAGEARVRKDDPRQYENLWALLQENFWKVRLAVPPLPYPTSHSPGSVLEGLEQLNGRQTDECLKQVASGRGCAVTRGCLLLMGSQIYSGYSLTHQVLFLIAGVQAGCKVHLDTLAAELGVQGGVGGLLARLCSVVLSEAREIAQAGFPEHRHDLFMEQGAVCGLLGYRAFFQEAWVERVLSWQHEAGCYGGHGHQHLSATQHAPAPLDSLYIRGRRDELVMTSGCLAHRSAVALGYLAVFTRHASVDT